MLMSGCLKQRRRSFALSQKLCPMRLAKASLNAILPVSNFSTCILFAAVPHPCVLVMLPN